MPANPLIPLTQGRKQLEKHCLPRPQMQNTRIRNEVVKTSHFYRGQKKYRLSYTSRGSLKRASIHLNQPLSDAGSVVRDILCCQRYLAVRIFLNRKYFPVTEEERDAFVGAVSVDGYAVTVVDVYTNQQDYIMICQAEKKEK